jgi:hypothetical protein
MVVKRPDLIRHAQIVEFIVRIEAIGRHPGHIGVFHVVVLPLAQIVVPVVVRATCLKRLLPTL